MTKTEFAGFIREHGPVILDGATGTNLMEAGMPIGVCPESWVLENPQVLKTPVVRNEKQSTAISYMPPRLPETGSNWKNMVCRRGWKKSTRSW